MLSDKLAFGFAGADALNEESTSGLVLTSIEPIVNERGVDAAFELVQSGSSLQANRLVLLEDNIAQVELMQVEKLATEKGTL